MASSIIILKPVKNYLPQETILAFKKAVLDAGMIFNKVEIKYELDGKFTEAEGCIGFIDDDNTIQQFLFTINNIDEYSEDSFEWLVPGKKLFWAIDIENIGDHPCEIFKFAVQYFFENSNDFLWLDSLKWAYSAKEIIQLSQLPYDSKWLYEKLV